MAGMFLLNAAYTAMAWPVLDEICRATISIHSFGDVLASVQQAYLIWTGRWLSMAIYASIVPFLGITTFGYTLALALLQAIWFAIFYGAVSFALGRIGVGRGIKALFAATLTVTFWAGMALPLENWYWLSGTVEYVLPLAVLLIGLRSLASRQIEVSLTACGCGIIVGGLNELGAMLYVVIIGLWLVAALAYREKGSVFPRGLLIVLLFAGGGFLINYLAPGNALRAASEFPDGKDIAVAAKSLMQISHSPLGWLLDKSLWVLTAMALTTPTILACRPKWSTSKAPLFVLIPLICLIATSLAYLAIYYVQGSEPPKRAINLMYALFMISWMLGVVDFTSRFNIRIGLLPHQGQTVRALATLIFGLCLIMSPVTEAALGDLSYTYHIWRAAKLELFNGRSRQVAIDRDLRQPKLYVVETLIGENHGRYRIKSDFGQCYRRLLGKTLYPVASGAKY
jgi:hypothetical protein